MRNKVSGAIAVSKASWGCAQPCRISFRWFPKNHFISSTVQTFFCAKNTNQTHVNHMKRRTSTFEIKVHQLKAEENKVNKK